MIIQEKREGLSVSGIRMQREGDICGFGSVAKANGYWILVF